MNKKMILLLVTFSYYCNAQGIVFTRQINNNDDILFLSEEGKVTVLANHRAKDSSPMISPDGKAMVFTSERVGWWKIWKMDLETKEVKQLTFESSAAYAPMWSPDGKQIIYTGTKDGNQEVYIMNSDGSNQRNITKSKRDDVTPFWANDGFIYFSAIIEEVYQIMKCKPDGTELTQLTYSNGDKLMPQLSPDANSILYYGNETDDNIDVFLFKIGSKSSVRLTNHALMDMRPRWSPDGKKIVFERGNKGNNHHIFIMDADGSNVQQLTFDSYNYAPSFLPN